MSELLKHFQTTCILVITHLITACICFECIYASSDVYVYVDAFEGFKCGKFLERCRVKKPNQPRYPVEFSKYYTLCDLYVGAVLDINNFKFKIIDADEYAYTYLEKHANEVR
jgi:hypothetical protein